MTASLDPEIERVLIDCVHARIDHIRSRDRHRLDLTYCPMCLSLRNEHNRHDYDWYMNLIEDGFGVQVERIDIVPVGDATSLPFPGMVTFPNAPHYKVQLTTITGRHTLWLVRISQDGPKVVVPAFNGSVADSVALGCYPWRKTAEPFEGPATLVEFQPEEFAQKVAQDIAFRLKNVWHRHKFETLRAITLDCHPWHPVLSICLLTTQEDESFREDEYGKWDIAAWRLFQVADLDTELQRLIYDYSEGRTTTDRDKDSDERVEAILRCCATALQHRLVRESLGKFQLASDFEVVLFHPDDGDANRDYCRLVGDSR